MLAPWETYGKQYREYAHKYVKALLTSVTLFLQQKVNNVFFFFCNKAAQVHQGQLFPAWLMSTNLALKKHQLSQWSSIGLHLWGGWFT